MANQIQVRLKTTNDEFAVPDSTTSVPASVGSDQLNKLVHSLLTNLDKDSIPDFDFFIADDLLRTSLEDFVAAREDISSEHVLDILYLEQKASPEPQDSVNHDDWVAGIDVRNGLILSACYDNTVCLWDAKDGSKKQQIPSHTAPVRDVAFIDVDENKNATFVSVSHDQTVVLHKYCSETNTIEGINVGKGHARSVDCVSVDPTKQYVATGSFDTNLKIWSANLTNIDEAIEEDGDEGSGSKKAKNSSKAPTRTPLVTIAGHKEGIAGVTWMESATEVITCSWDHTIRIWDAEMATLKTELVGNKAFFDVSYSPEKKMLLAASCERTIRMYDPRSSEGLIVKSAYSSHQGWVSSVDWCKGNDQMFVSGSHDSLLKIWDVRACKTPLFDLRGHSDQVLAVSWQEPAIIVSGGADNDMKIFKSNVK